jgi:hypothetical protein
VVALNLLPACSIGFGIYSTWQVELLDSRLTLTKSPALLPNHKREEKVKSQTSHPFKLQLALVRASLLNGGKTTLLTIKKPGKSVRMDGS